MQNCWSLEGAPLFMCRGCIFKLTLRVSIYLFSFFMCVAKDINIIILFISVPVICLEQNMFLLPKANSNNFLKFSVHSSANEDNTQYLGGFF